MRVIPDIEMTIPANLPKCSLGKWLKGENNSLTNDSWLPTQKIHGWYRDEESIFEAQIKMSQNSIQSVGFKNTCMASL